MIELPEPTDDILEVPRDCQSDCADKDEDCDDVRNKVVCWLHDPGRGMCPYLRGSL